MKETEWSHIMYLVHEQIKYLIVEHKINVCSLQAFEHIKQTCGPQPPPYPAAGAIN